MAARDGPAAEQQQNVDNVACKFHYTINPLYTYHISVCQSSATNTTCIQKRKYSTKILDRLNTL